MSQRITPDLFKSIKIYSQWNTSKRCARKHSVSLKTILQIRGSRNFEQYTENNKAQHPPYKIHSLRDDLLDIHSLIFNKHDNRYLTPLTGKKAAMDIKLKLMEERRI